MPLNRIKKLFDNTPNAAKLFTDSSTSPWLISFPRTGSHWLRMILEKVSNQPLLPRSFYDHNNENYLLNHTHDYEFARNPSKLIYLYRDPVPTVFSQIRFHKHHPFDKWQVELWSTIYKLHLQHWLLTDHTDRTLITYEDMQNNLHQALIPVLNTLNINTDQTAIEQAAQEIDHAHVTSKTTHDKRVMNNEVDYNQQREQFTCEFGNYIRDKVILEGNLEQHFKHLIPLKVAA